MDYEKAIEVLAPVTITFSQKGFNREMYEALCLAKEALEKQIPSNLRITQNEIVCPRCATLVGSAPLLPILWAKA